MPRSDTLPIAGSSPHAGTGRPGGAFGAGGVRLIPARGDRTSTRRPGRRPTGAHPRTRGPDRTGCAATIAAHGSSPHAGTGRVAPLLPDRVQGLIPARGDRTRSRPWTTGARAAHPRTRGPDLSGAIGDALAAGSSPHAGTGRRRDGRREDRRRLIPARGDRTRPDGLAGPGGSAHPRTRGPDRGEDFKQADWQGSSPHAGTGHDGAGSRADGSRLIPARGDRTHAPGDHPRRHRAHPRTRGPDRARASAATPIIGSSPHAGTGRACDANARLERGLIPARGDRTGVDRRMDCGIAAHPRTRGPDEDAMPHRGPCGGSSPHAGTGLTRAVAVHEATGLIPARGDRTRMRRRRSRQIRAHPRTRGPDAVALSLAGFAGGSSPHAGTGPASVSAWPWGWGLIPARGDRTGPNPGGVAQTPAHPRTRGPDVIAGRAHNQYHGSSPHAGTGHHRGRRGQDRRGLIPARGDRTLPVSWESWTGAAHPRTRGPDSRSIRLLVRKSGSSPHAGTGPAGSYRRRHAGRLIPARGDRTSPSRTGRSRARAHPRTRGPDTTGTEVCEANSGSSPHAGTGPCHVPVGHPAERLIPARGDRTTPRRPATSPTPAHPRTRGPDPFG